MHGRGCRETHLASDGSSSASTSALVDETGRPRGLMTCMFAMELGARGGSGDETVAIHKTTMDSTQSSANGCGSRAYSTVSGLQFLDSLSRLQLYDVRASAFREWRQASNSQNSENSGFFQIITATRSRNSAVSRPLPLRRNSYYSSYF